MGMIDFVARHSDYYSYLLKISWPALSGLFLIYFFFLVRFCQVFRLYYKKRTKTNLAKLTARIFFSLIVLLIYTNMFIMSYGDWLLKPSQAKGVVESMELKQNQDREDYLMTLKSGEERLIVAVDSNVYKTLKQNDLVEIKYLSERKEVFSCIILNRQPTNSI